VLLLISGLTLLPPTLVGDNFKQRKSHALETRLRRSLLDP
jgi:hypothetical protein